MSFLHFGKYLFSNRVCFRLALLYFAKDILIITEGLFLLTVNNAILIVGN